MNKRFLLAITAFLLFVFLLEWNVPTKFSWKPTFSHEDHQPFGSAVFDSIVGRSVKAGYRVTTKTLAQLEREQWRQPHAVILQSLYFQPSAADLRALDKMVRGGHIVLIAVNSMEGDTLKKRLGVYIDGEISFLPDKMRDWDVQVGANYDSLYWEGKGPYNDKIYRIYHASISGGVMSDGPCDTLLRGFQPDVEYETESKTQSKIIAKRHGKGKILYAATPLLLTNYGILDPEINGLVFRILSQLGDYPIVRTEAYMPHREQVSESPFDFFLRQAPLRWALYLSLAGLVLFCVFFARRRQRVIPVIKAPENKALEFVKLIGTLYFQWHVNHDLLRKKHNYFAETLRRTLMIDVENTAKQKEHIEQLAYHTGLAEDDIRAALELIDRYLEDNRELSDDELRHAIDTIDNILHKI